MFRIDVINTVTSVNKNKVFIKKADLVDISNILKLQYLCYESEALLFCSRDIPLLKQTIQEVEKEYQEGTILKLVDDENVIIGSVRFKKEGKTIFIGKLMVHPTYQKHGFGTKLLLAIEDICPNMRYELFTSTKSISNINLYQKLGYIIFKQKQITDELSFVYLEKITKTRLVQLNNLKQINLILSNNQ